nr:immunoglobulin heavy chain junction region [Mus musculus]
AVYYCARCRDYDW